MESDPFRRCPAGDYGLRNIIYVIICYLARFWNEVQPRLQYRCLLHALFVGFHQLLLPRGSLWLRFLFFLYNGCRSVRPLWRISAGPLEPVDLVLGQTVELAQQRIIALLCHGLRQLHLRIRQVLLLSLCCRQQCRDSLLLIGIRTLLHCIPENLVCTNLLLAESGIRAHLGPPKSRHILRRTQHPGKPCLGHVSGPKAGSSLHLVVVLPLPQRIYINVGQVSVRLPVFCIPVRLQLGQHGIEHHLGL